MKYLAFLYFITVHLAEVVAKKCECNGISGGLLVRPTGPRAWYTYDTWTQSRVISREKYWIAAGIVTNLECFILTKVNIKCTIWPCKHEHDSTSTATKNNLTILVVGLIWVAVVGIER